MRLIDIIRNAGEAGLRYAVEFTGPNRRKRRMVKAKDPGLKAAKPRRTASQQRRYRSAIKDRRKQAWGRKPRRRKWRRA